MSLFKITVIQHWLRDCWIGPDGKPCSHDTPGARDVKARRVPAVTPGARKVKKKSAKWYTRLPGSAKAVALCTNKVAAEQMRAELVRKADQSRAGLIDPFEQHSSRPLVEH